MPPDSNNVFLYLRVILHFKNLLTFSEYLQIKITLLIPEDVKLNRITVTSFLKIRDYWQDYNVTKNLVLVVKGSDVLSSL